MSKLWVRRTLFLKLSNIMATTQRKTIMSGPSRLTGNKSGPSRSTGKFVSRPIVVREGYVKIPLKSAVEYNLNKKDQRLAFRGFKTQANEIRLEELSKKIAQLKAQTQRVWALKPRGERSFASVASVGARPILGLSHRPTPPPPRELAPWSRLHARRDYDRAFKKMENERKTALELVRAMAARRPIIVFRQRETVTFVKRQELKAAIRAARKERKERARPKEVEEFPLFCYPGYQPTPLKEKVVTPVVEDEVPRVAQPTSVKQKKVRAIIREPEVIWYSCAKQETPKTPMVWDRITRRRMFVAFMERTSLGRVLMAGLLRVKAERAGRLEACEEASSYFEELQNKIQPQMDPEGVVGQTATEVTKASNTLIDSVQPLDVGIAHQLTHGFQNFSVSKEIQSFSTMSNRWLIAKQITWTTSHRVGDELLVGYYLPKQILVDNPSAQNTQLFYTHRWFRGDMRIRFALNSNAFQVGMLVGSVCYSSKNTSLCLWDNIYSALQRNHCKLNAGSGNDGELVVPFKWHNSMMTFLTDSQMCKLSLRCLTPLNVTQGVATSCSVTIFITFENIEFYGMISRELGITPQMDSIANVLNAGANVIATLRGDANRDNPPLPLQPVSLVPQSMTSLSAMDGQVEPVNVLRADPRGQTPHADMSNEMGVYDLIRGWGYIRSFAWTSTQTQGTQIFKVQVVPLRSIDSYPVDNNCAPSGAVLTPLAYISSMFGKFRGDIEYKFEIVASKFHVGRLIIGAVPLMNTQTCTLDNLRYSAYRIADVADTAEIIFRVPWHWYNAFASVRGSTNPVDVPATLYVLVINPLIAIDSVPPEVTVNVYERAADNFELAIPRPSIINPILGDTVVPPSNQYLKPYNLENKWYTTWERNLKRSDGNYLTTIYVQNISDGWVGYLNTQLGAVYQLNPKTTKGIQFRCHRIQADGSRRKIKFGVADPSISNSNAQGLIVFQSATEATKFAKALKEGQDAQKARSDVSIDECWTADGPWSELFINGSWVEATNDGDPPIWLELNLAEEFEVITAQMDTTVSTPITVTDIPSACTSMGLQIFGESTPDLKSLCRRYNHLCSVKTKTRLTENPRDSPYAARIRVHPIRHIHPTSSASYDNRYRHGIITQIGMMYRFWRGGLRYRFVVVGSPPEGTILYVQHRFDKDSATSRTVALGPSKVSSRDDMMNTQYATFAQVLSVNTSFVIEVPFYKENEVLSVTPETSPKEHDNGQLYLWFHSKAVQDVHIEVFYSFADDCRFSVFQGIPKSMDLNSLVPEPQMDPQPNTSGVTYNKKSEKVESQGMLTAIMDTLRAPKKISEQAVSVAEDVKETKNHLKSTLDSLKGLSDKISSKFSDTTKSVKNSVVRGGIASVFDLLCDAKDHIFSVFTHLIYVVLSPTVSTIGWAVMNLYHTLYGFTLDGIHVVTSFVKEMWEKSKALYSSKHPQRSQIKPQGDDSLVGSYAGLLFTGLATMCRVTAKPPKDWGSVAEGLFSFSNAARSGSFVSRFFEDNMELFRRVWSKFVAIFGVDDTENLNLIAGIHDNRLKTWILEASVVTAAHNAQRVLSEPDWSQKVFELAVVGRSLQIVLTNTHHTLARVTNLVNDYMKLLKVLEKRLVDSKIYSGVRYEPWCLWVAGRAGTGKTRYLQSVADQLAEMAGYRGQTSYHTITAGQKYMDGFVGQPTILLDDFMTMTPSADPESYAQFLQMVSSALYNPPFAVAEEKNKLVNFNNLLVSANRVFFQNISGISDVEAYNRRRKCLLEFDFLESDTTADNLVTKYTNEQLQKMEHVKVFIYHSPSDPASTKEEIPRVTNEDYSVTVNRVIMDRATQYHLRETQKYRVACESCIQKLEETPRQGTTLGEQLKAASDALSKFGTGKYFQSTDCFKNWLTNCTEASTFLLPELGEIEPQDDPNPFAPWPANWKEIDGATNLDDLQSSDQPVEPMSRTAVSAPPYKSTQCLHQTFDYDYLNWDEEGGVYFSHRKTEVNERMALSMPHGPCLLKRSSGEFIPSPSCVWEKTKDRIFYRIFINKMDEVENNRDLEYARCHNDWSVFDNRYHPDVVSWIKTTFEKKTFATEMKQLNTYLEKSMEKKRREFETVDGVSIPKKPLWKRISSAVWSALVMSLKIVAECILVTTSLIVSLIGISYVLTKFMPSETVDDNPEPNLHPSGDYKTVRNARTIQTRAVKLMDGEGAEMSSENDVLMDCSVRRSQSMGSLNKIVSNSFFLVGKVPVSDTTFVTYKARCLGVYNKKFLVIKHYIEHFRASGVERVCVVFHGANSMMEYDLDDFDFRWSPQGYGISELPASAPRNFKNILKQIPSERFDGNYPSDCVVIEPFIDEVIEHQITLKRIVNPKVVPATTTQSAWTIEQGFEYNWGGKGKCGSFVFAPSMACPLIGIHTAGIDDRRGFAELLLRETFDDFSQHKIDYVTPQMNKDPSVYGLDGFYEQVGKLDADLVPSMPNQTKIEPSEIQGVFPITTQPAPLSGKDERLVPQADILKIGVSKRCNPLREFPAYCVNTAYLSICRMYKKVLRPVRSSIGPLSFIQACEGLSVEGYDSMEFRTSEGYPWTKLRPKQASDKSWMFDLDTYPDGRIRVKGFIPELLNVLEGKAKLRKEGIVPASYFTACLKDARIPLHKVPVAGSTRVFEMSPVDLTIAQRQYFMDFTVAYRKARFAAENSIGINPDGPEWTQLVTHLTEFSPCILTADYSGYGPRLAHSLLERSFDASIAWLTDNEECEEEEANDRCITRLVLKHEVTHGLHVVRDLVFRPTCGLPSGNCETVERNSQTNSLYIRIAFYKLAERHAPTYRDPFWFDQKVRLVTNGDDLIAAVKEDIISWFNNRTLIEFFAEYGLKMTDALKSGVVRDYCSIEEATYLKRGFQKHPTREGQWMAPLDKNSVTDTANWVWRSVDKRQASLVNSEAACRLAYTCGPEFYEQVCDAIQKRWADIEVPFEYPPWELLDNHVWEGSEGPKFSF